MNPDIFSQWLERQGYRVVRTPSSYWFNQGPRVYQAFPYHWIIQPSQDELEQLLQWNGAIGLRYSTPVNAPEGAISYHAVYEKSKYDFDDLGKWARKNVRRGLKHCRVEQITFELLACDGWRLQIDTLARQGRELQVAENRWSVLCRSAVDLPGFDAWGALIDNQLVASVITFQMNDCGYMLYQQCLREYLPQHVNNALCFVVTQHLIARPGIRSILYGLHSLDAPASVDDFKFRMGYIAKPVRQRVVFNPLLAPLFNSASHAMLKSLHRWLPGNPALAKAEGMVRFYLEGKRPLSRQTMPPALQEILAEDDANA